MSDLPDLDPLRRQLADAIVRDDAAAVRALVTSHPVLLHEPARDNWGPPMSYAANLGRSAIVEMLGALGAPDRQHAFDRACLQGQIETARALHAAGARPGADAILGPCETLQAEGLRYLVSLGAPVPAGAVAAVLQTYTRRPAGKHACLALLGPLPDTPPLALHQGRLDLLEAHLRRDPGLLGRHFAHAEIWPPSLGCDADESLALHGTPLAGAGLLHMAIDYGEEEIVRWLLAEGADPNLAADVDAEGFGGHTPLFSALVTQMAWFGATDELARLLLARGARVDVRASLRKHLRFVEAEGWHERRDVTAREWAEGFPDKRWVNDAALRRVVETCDAET
jgi:ankyrin repeat protein